MMTWTKGIAMILAGTLVAACDPTGSVDADQQAYHKANRDAYLYQGL